MRLGYRTADDLLDDLTPHEFEEWFTAYAVGALDIDAWRRAGLIACAVHNNIERIVAGFSRGSKPHYVEPQDYIPAHFADQTKKRKPQTAEQIEQQLRMAYGNHRRPDSQHHG